MDSTSAAVPISEARSELAELVTRARMLHEVIPLSQRGKIRAALISPELAEAITAAGGEAAAIRLLERKAR